MSDELYKPPTVEIEPKTELTSWKVFEVKKPEGEVGWDIHFVGRTFWGGRVSSAIKIFDHKTRVGVTISGREYELNGLPGDDFKSNYVWGSWLATYNHPDYREVTDQYTPLV